MQKVLNVETNGKGLYEITPRVSDFVLPWAGEAGLCNIFIQHTSASLIIQENADPSAKRDLEYFFSKLVPEDFPGFTHTSEGPDDMPSHIRSALTQTQLTIPVADGKLALGTWQGIYLWEHRRDEQKRRVLVTLISLT